jgi:hypothetical protein
MCVLFFRRILVNICYILIGKLNFDYMFLLFSLLVLSVFIVLVVSNAILMFLFLNSFVIILVMGQYCVKVAGVDFVSPVNYC